MNFFKSIKVVRKYLIFSKNKINEKFFFLSNIGLFVGKLSLFKLLTIYVLIKDIKHVKGDIIVFGVWNGKNLLSMKNIIVYLNIKKKIYGYDWFKGLKNFSKYDQKINRKKYIGNKKKIQNVIKFFGLKKIYLIDDDVSNFTRYFKKSKKFSFVYLDLDLFKPTIQILNIINKNLQKNGLIVFDQANKLEWPGENKAMQNFYFANKKKYKKIKLNKNFSPDIILKK